MGDVENATKEAEINIEGMEAEKYDYIVSACPSCTHQLRDYPTFFEEGTEMHKRATNLQARHLISVNCSTTLAGAKNPATEKLLKLLIMTAATCAEVFE